MIESKFTPIKGAALRIAEEFAASDTAPVEGVVLPDDEVTLIQEDLHSATGFPRDVVQSFPLYHAARRKLAEAVAQRDEARTELKRTSIDLREEIAAIRRSWKFEWNRAEKAEAALATARAQGREEGLREALEFVQRERLDNHEDAIACIPGVHETDTSYSNAIRDAENVIISLIPKK